MIAIHHDMLKVKYNNSASVILKLKIMDFSTTSLCQKLYYALEIKVIIKTINHCHYHLVPSKNLSAGGRLMKKNNKVHCDNCYDSGRHEILLACGYRRGLKPRLLGTLWGHLFR